MNRTCVYILGLLIFLNGTPPLGLAQEENTTEGGHVPKNNFTILYKLAEIYIDYGNYVGAVDVYTLLLEEYPENMRIYNLRGFLQHALGRLDEAEKDYTHLVDHGAADSAILNNLGVIAVEQNEFDKAKQWFVRAIKADPGIAEAHNNLAELFMRQEAYADAIIEFNTVIGIERDNMRAMYNLGVTYMNVKNFVKAEEQWGNLITLNPNDGNIKDMLEQARSRQKAPGAGKNREKIDAAK